MEPLFLEAISPPLSFLFFVFRPVVSSHFYQVWTRVLIHIDNKIIGGSALENSDGVNLPVGWGDSILSGVVCRLVVLVCLSSGGVLLSAPKFY